MGPAFVQISPISKTLTKKLTNMSVQRQLSSVDDADVFGAAEAIHSSRNNSSISVNSQSLVAWKIKSSAKPRVSESAHLRGSPSAPIHRRRHRQTPSLSGARLDVRPRPRAG